MIKYANRICEGCRVARTRHAAAMACIDIIVTHTPAVWSAMGFSLAANIACKHGRICLRVLGNEGERGGPDSMASSRVLAWLQHAPEHRFDAYL